MRRHDRGTEPGGDFIRTIEIKNREGQVVERKEVVTAKGLLHLAHNERLSKIRSTVVQAPSKENGDTTIVHVHVRTSRGEFDAIGDANPRNVTPKIAPHAPRMAETRALARALRAALDIGAVAVEELEEEFSFVENRREAPPQHRHETSHQRAEGDRPRAEGDRPRDERRANGHPTNGSPRANGQSHDRGAPPTSDVMSDPQKKMLYRIAFEQGHEGENARAWLHAELRVDSLAKVGRRQASAFIDHYKSNGNGRSQGDNGHAGA
jgi:hypothetical protein